ncbi:MAG: hypothetical protein V3R80_12930 [Candidatus Tectomicrobia bacterium]
MRKAVFIVSVLTLMLFAAGVMAQQMKGMQPSTQVPMQEKQPCSAKTMPMMDMGKVPNPELLVTTFEKQVVLPDAALSFEPTGMGEKFFAKLIAKVDSFNLFRQNFHVGISSILSHNWRNETDAESCKEGNNWEKRFHCTGSLCVIGFVANGYTQYRIGSKRLCKFGLT